MQFLVQRKRSDDCGAVAVLNAALWTGLDVSQRHVRPVAAFLGTESKIGASSHMFDQLLKRTLKRVVGPIRHPKAGTLLRALCSGKGVILLYRWRQGEMQRGHYAFLCRTVTGKIRLANPDRTHKRGKSGRGPRFSYITEEELARMCKPSFIPERGRYPSAWILNRDESINFRKLLDRLNG